MIQQVITAPETEMLLVHYFDLYRDDKKDNGKPSVFPAKHFGKPAREIKSKQYIEHCFDSTALKRAIEEYARVSRKRKVGDTLAFA